MIGSYAFNPIRMMNIPSWIPAWSNASGKLDPAHYQDFANWCADLVRIVNIESGVYAQYWEVPNERDQNPYDGDNAELGRIYNLAAQAMKAVDPSIKVGGPAFHMPHLTANVDAFFSIAAPNLDFVSYHGYAVGDETTPVNEIWNIGAGLGWVTNTIKAEWSKYSTRQIEFYHNEFNIHWGGDHYGHKNA